MKPSNLVRRYRIFLAGGGQPDVGDWGWLMVVGSGIAYEILAGIFGKELLSMAATRYRTHHPLYLRLIVAVLAAHFGGALPPCFDVFSDRGPVHQYLAACWPSSTPPPWCRKVEEIRKLRP
jgi:hypothetical protein